MLSLELQNTWSLPKGNPVFTGKSREISRKINRETVKNQKHAMREFVMQLHDADSFLTNRCK